MKLPQDRILHIDTEFENGKLNVVAEWQGELVRCKNCKWFNHVGCAIRVVDDSDKPTENDFCSFGERRAKNNEPEVKITETDMMYVGENYKV